MKNFQRDSQNFLLKLLKVNSYSCDFTTRNVIDFSEKNKWKQFA